MAALRNSENNLDISDYNQINTPSYSNLLVISVWGHHIVCIQGDSGKFHHRKFLRGPFCVNIYTIAILLHNITIVNTRVLY